MTAVAGVERALRTADAGVRAVATRLSAATVDGDRLRVDGDPLSTEDLAAVAGRAVRDAGGDPAGVTVVETRDGALRPDDPVVVALEPRVDGVAGPLSRTFVVDGTGGWERRAAVAVGMAHDAVRRVVEPGVPARRVVEEAVAELGAYGLAADDPVARPIGGRTDAAAFDVSTETPLDAGDAFVLDPAARDPDPDADRGRVRVSECYAVTGSGCRSLGATPTSLSPDAY